MLATLLRALWTPRTRAPRVPAGSRVYAVGDMHGRADLVEAIHGLILRDILDFDGDRKVVVYLGDYVDRGMDSRELVDLLLDAPLPGFEAVHLEGNHEQALLDFLDDPGVALEWMSYGGYETLASYGVGFEGPPMGAQALMRLQERFRTNLPARHLDFFRGLRLTHEEGDYLFVHAGLRPGVPIGDQEAHDLLWIRDPFLDSTEDFGRVVVHGHSISTRPEMRPNRIGIDTGAFASGCLTCLVLEGTGRRFLAT
jgi:serine/threonine protein phosphatase 1